MPTLPPAFASVMIAFRSVFSKRVFANAMVLLIGAILAPGRRTVAAALRAVGLAQLRAYHKYHRVLSQARWSARRASRTLLWKLVEALVPEDAPPEEEVSTEPLVFGIDDTIERRRGKKINAKGIYRDPVRSSKGHFVKASGLRWLSMMLLCRIPWAGRVWALPFLTVLCPSKRYNLSCGRRHKTLTEWARQMIVQLRRWLPDRKLVVVGDSSFAALEFLSAASEQATILTRLRLDAALYAPAPPRQPGQPGRPRKKGKRLPSLNQVLFDPQTKWRSVTASWWYGTAHNNAGGKELEIATGTAVWYHSGKPVVPLRWVLARDPNGMLDPRGFLCTELEVSATDILRWFVRRWSVEVTFEEVRCRLGVETQRQWSDLAILRTTPCLLGLFSVVTLVADRLHEQHKLAVREAVWYKKKRPTFSDALAAVRKECWYEQHFSMSDPPTETTKIPRSLLERLIEAVSYTA